ncbi:MAG: alpha-2-macroglobulin [Hyphomonadaceae bacterium]
MSKQGILRAIAFGAASLAMAALTACGGGDKAAELRDGPDGPQLTQRAENARRAATQSSRDFEFVRYAIDVSENLPRACLTFSSTLDEEKDYSPYVEMDRGGPVALSVKGANLCIGGLTFGQPRELTIRSGLPAQDGRSIAFDETVRIEFGDRPSFVGFSGDGVILPRVEADGLAIQTVNADKVHVTVSRVTDRALAFKTITSGFAVQAGDYGWMDYNSEPDELLEPVWEGEMDTVGSPNSPKITVFPIATAIPRLQAGAYFIELNQADATGKIVDRGARAKRWLVITDLALTSYTGEDGVTTTVRSLQSAKPQRGVELQLVARNNEILATGTSDRDGHVSFPGPAVHGDGPMAPRLIMAYAENGDFAVLDLDRSPTDLTERDVGGRSPAGQADAYVYFDRGIYRPGETVKATALIRDATANALKDRAGALVVYAPNGIEAGRTRFDKAEDAGAVRFDFAVPRAAARGSWRMAAQVDGVGEVGSASFSVEDFVPQRIALTVNADDETPMRAGQTRTINADVRFLYGAPGAGLPVEGDVRVEADPSPFPKLKDFRFGRHDEEFRDTTFETPDATTDGSGHASLMLAAREAGNGSSRPLRFRVVVSAVEPGGRAVRDDVRVPYRPNNRYLGVKPAFDQSAEESKPAAFDIVSVDAMGAQKSGAVNWRLVRIDWKYDWYREGGGQWQWRRSREVVEVETGTARIAEGQTARIETRALDWGDYELLLTEAATGAEASYGFWAGWGGQAQDGVDAPDQVRIEVPDTLPEVGKTIEIGLMPPYDGEAEIVIASENVITTRTLSVKAGGARVKLPVTKDWGAGVYIMASVYTPRDPVERPKPRRAVGVAHVSVDMKPRTFDLKMTAPEILRPNSKLDLQVEATSGPVREGAYVTVAAVDEGVLLLTGFKSPDPVKYFFGKRRLGVDLHDDYGRLLDPNQGAAAQARSGGDQIGGAGLSVVPTKTVALFSGPVQLDKSGKATVSIDVPDFNGELRLMAVAWSDTGLGAASQPLTVRDIAPAELILPRFLAPGDEAVATVTIDNVEAPAGQFQATLASDGPVSASDLTLSAQIAAKQRSDLSTSISTRAAGVSNIQLSVKGPGGYAVSHSYPIETRSPYLPASYVTRRTLQPGETFSPATNALATFVPGSGYVQVSASAIPMDAAALFDSLDRYPYGCTEQTVSRAMPLLYADQMAALAGRKAPDALHNQVQEAVSTLLNRQSADGAIGLWRIGDRSATPWLGAYATDFLARAKAAGYVVPDAAMDRAYDALEEIAIRESRWSTAYDFDVYESRWNNDTGQKLMDRSIAYAAYVLARAGRMDKSRLRYLHDERMSRISSPLARAQIGAALNMIGDKARSKSAFDRAQQALGYQNSGDWYQTTRRDLAGVLALAAEVKDADRVQALADRTARDLPEPDRLTTQEKAFLLLAAHALSGGSSDVTVTTQGAASVLSDGRAWKIDESQIGRPASFTNTGSNPVWITSIAHGNPSSAPPPAADGMFVRKQLWTPTGRAIDGASFRQGDRVIIAITVLGSENRTTPAIIADLLPAGFEIEGVLRPDDSRAYAFLGDIASPKIAEARDDRFVAAIDLFDRNAETLAYVVRAVTPGTFAMPGAVAEDMYRPDTFARSDASRITIAPRN